MKKLKIKKSRKQRKAKFTAPLHQRRKCLSAHLEESLLLKYDKRSIPVVKGDTVKVMRGSFSGHVDKVAMVDIKKEHVEIEGVTMLKADGKKIGKLIHASNLLITKINLTDPWRREKLERKLPEETRKEIEKEAEEQLKELEQKVEEKTEEEKVITEEITAETKEKESTADEKKKIQKTEVKQVEKTSKKDTKKGKEKSKIVTEGTKNKSVKKTGGKKK
ncbi:ribosomal protein L24p/L26e, archaeal/eukaryotic [Thermoplasmatales archaeon SCGC AB-539-N05]|nr:ribosomal protein L24p/L26e, archaeal/eukaryotic [Thermoplasmatales archaeon SCGC AB-539-N05]